MTEAGGSAIIEIREVEKTYRRFGGRSIKALDGVSLSIQEGEVFGLIGPNGAGKTTLLTCLLGLLRPDRGEIRIDGCEPDDLAIRERTGYLPERLGFDRDLCGRDFLTMHARLARVRPPEIPNAVREGVERTELPVEALRRPLKTYSRGMLQRIGVAQALLGNPSLLFFDEPASGMDPAGVALVRRRILEAKARGATVVLNSHQLPEVEKVCGRVAFIARGKIERLEVLRAGEGQRRAWTVRVKAGQEARALDMLEAAGLAAVRGPDNALRAEGEETDVEKIAPALIGAGLTLLELKVTEANLEALFLGGQPRG